MQERNTYSQKIGRFVTLSSLRGDWGTVKTGVNAASSATLLRNPSSLIASAAQYDLTVFKCQLGTSVIVRLKYDDGFAGTITSPVIKVYGIDSNGKFHFLKNSNSTTPVATSTLTVDTTNDITDGTYNYTDVGANQIYDLQGSTYFCVVVSTALASTDGGDAVAQAVVEAKVV